MRPYEQVAFQWSCHTIREKDGNLEHTEWINVVDAFPNFAFAEALMEQLGERGCPDVVAFAGAVVTGVRRAK